MDNEKNDTFYIECKTCEDVREVKITDVLDVGLIEVKCLTCGVEVIVDYENEVIIKNTLGVCNE